MTQIPDLRPYADLIALVVGLLLVLISLGALDWRLGGAVTGALLIVLALLPPRQGGPT